MLAFVRLSLKYRITLSYSSLILPLSSFDPLQNSLGQNPCVVARLLADECLGDDYDPPFQFYPLYPLQIDKDDDHYRPPTGAQASGCLCSSTCTLSCAHLHTPCQFAKLTQLGLAQWPRTTSSKPARRANIQMGPVRPCGATLWAIAPSRSGGGIRLMYRGIPPFLCGLSRWVGAPLSPPPPHSGCSAAGWY